MRNFMFITARVLIAAAAMLLTAHDVLSANPRSLNGVVQTGGTTSSQPVPNVHVTLFEATDPLPGTLGEATTDASGRFTIPYKKSSSSSIFFVEAEIGGGVEFVTILGPNLPASLTVNELTTVAASYSMAQFHRTGVIAGNSFGLQIAAGMNDNIVASATGQSSPVLLNSPNADQTNSLRSTRSLANLLAACVVDASVTATLFELTTPPGGSPPSNTAQSLANLARDPGQHVDGIYALTLLSNLYAPPLITMPDAWTVTVKVNDSGNDAPDFLISGPGNLAFDERGYAWVTNNTTQGSPSSCTFNLVLKPNGQPADGSNGTPRSPLTGGGILGAGFGVTVAPHGSVWFGNFGWGNPDCDWCFPSADGNGSMSRFTLTGMPVSPPDAYQGGPVRAQGLASDADGNIWISSYGNNSLYVFLHGNPHHAVSFLQYEGSGPFDVAIAADGTAWVASQGDGMVYAIQPDGTEIGNFNRGGMDSPWDTVIDGEDNVWVANFGSLQLLTPPFTGRLTKLWGVNAPAGHHVGEPISPETGYTVPTAGGEVLLHNGDPLYGPGAEPSFIPMMRQTSVVIDRAGNVWSINNWKPDFDIDILSNPGGDGIIIFVGLAAPPRPAH